jgi:hypothetical protein
MNNTETLETLSTQDTGRQSLEGPLQTLCFLC